MRNVPERSGDPASNTVTTKAYKGSSRWRLYLLLYSMHWVYVALRLRVLGDLRPLAWQGCVWKDGSWGELSLIKDLDRETVKCEF